LYFIQNKLGGNLVNESKKEHHLGNRKIYKWQEYGNKAADIIEILLPFFIVKKDQAILALEFQRKIKTHFARYSQEQREIEEKYYLQLRALKRKEY